MVPQLCLVQDGADDKEDDDGGAAWSENKRKTELSEPLTFSVFSSPPLTLFITRKLHEINRDTLSPS